MNVNKTINFDVDSAYIVEKLAQRLDSTSAIVMRAILEGVTTQYVRLLKDPEVEIKNVMNLNVQIAIPKVYQK